jgi:glycosyltransferase involved in cell wall biosynthesis
MTTLESIKMRLMGEKMKVSILGKWPDDLDGGVAVHTVNLVESMSKLKEIDLHFISFGDKSKTIKMNNTEIILLKSRWIYYIIPILPILKLNAEIKKINPDILQIQGTHISPYLIYTLFSFREFKKIVNVYGLMFMELSFNKGSLFNKLHYYTSVYIENYVLSHFSNIIVESNYIKRIIDKKTSSKVHVVPDGIETEKIKINNNTNANNAVGDELDIFLISRLVELKGIDILIESVSILKNKFPEIKVGIAGTGPCLNQLKKLTKELELENNIHFLGFILEEEKYRYYRSSKIVVVPSRWDCSPISIFEGLGAGKPVVASNNTNSEILEDCINGFIFESENIQDLAIKIEFLLKNHQLREKMSEEAFKKAKQYSWNNIAKKYLEVYKETMEIG